MATKTKAKAQTSAPPAYTCAMDKLRDEMAKSKQRYVQVVGEYLTDYLQHHPEAEEKLMAAGKSIEGSLGAMKNEAEKVKQGNVGILDDATAFGIVLRYYGIEGEATAAAGTSSDPASGATLQKPSPLGKVPPRGADEVPAAVESAPDPFDLDALLGGI